MFDLKRHETFYASANVHRPTCLKLQCDRQNVVRESALFCVQKALKLTKCICKLKIFPGVIPRIDPRYKEKGMEKGSGEWEWKAGMGRKGRWMDGWRGGDWKEGDIREGGIEAERG
jgi:hypothetical protein